MKFYRLLRIIIISVALLIFPSIHFGMCPIPFGGFLQVSLAIDDPGCTNGDCPKEDPGCTNGDCPPEEPSPDCCCVGSNLPGTTRVCCCRSIDLDTVNCRESLVIDTDSPEFHSTIADVTMAGFRPKKCDILLQNFCNPPVEEVCKWRFGQRICEKVIKRVCATLDQICRYNFCGPNWFPYDAPAPDQTGCGWWDQIRECPFPWQEQQ